MTVVVAPNVTQTLLRYLKQLRTNPKYQITALRAFEKYSDFSKYVHGGIVNDLYKGRLCGYYDLGQRYNDNNQPKFPNLKYLTYVDKSRFKWYVAYVYNENKDQLTVTRIKGASNVRESVNKGRYIITESQLRSIIRETVRRLLLTA